MKIENFELEKKAKWIRRQILESIASAKKGHIGGAFSCTDILVALYYGNILHYDVCNPKWEDRDRFILSKGHSGIALYTILADLGFFPLSELNLFCKNETMLGGHPDKNIPGIEVDSGSLGHGLGIGSGMSFVAKMDAKNFNTFVLLGDGECYEGSIWEAAMFAGHHHLNNLIAIVDRNNQCVTDFTEDCVSLEPFADKWKSFNWEVKIINGHSFDELLNVFNTIGKRCDVRPLLVVANTIKGKGVSYMEKQIPWHHSIPIGEQLEEARNQLTCDDNESRNE